MIIGVDLDEVLVEFVESFVSYHNNNYGTKLAKDDFHSYLLRETLKINKKEESIRLNKFYKSDYFRNMSAVPGSQQAVKSLIENDHDLPVITSRPESILYETHSCLDKHFPNIFPKIYFSYNHYTQHGRNKKTKPRLCLDLGVNILVEDSLEYAIECANAGIKVILLNQPWNQTEKLPNLVERTNSWKGIVSFIN